VCKSMSVTPKEMVFGAAAATAFLGLVVYNQHKFNKLQGEIDRLKEETKTMAQYIRILESKVAGDFHTILSHQDNRNHDQEGHHHHHHAHTGHPQHDEVPKVQQEIPAAKPALEEAKPDVPIIQRKPAPVHQVRQPVKVAPPVRAVHNPVRANPVVAKRAPPVQRKPIVVEDSHSSDEQDEKEEGSADESSSEATPQNSNRRSGNNTATRSGVQVKPNPPNAGVRSLNQPRNPVPRAAAALKAPTPPPTTNNPPAKPQHVITVQEGKPPKEKEEESYNPAEDNNRAAEISGGRPSPPKAGGPRTTGPKSGGGDKKRFGPKTDESEDSDKHVSSNKIKGKSILKNPSSGQLTNGDSKHLNGTNKDTTEKENSIDADLADDMAMVANKSSKRPEDNEGREVGQSEARAKRAKTAQIADAMKKRAEERAKKISSMGETPVT
jgi:hypothetical protein